MCRSTSSELPLKGSPVVNVFLVVSPRKNRDTKIGNKHSITHEIVDYTTLLQTKNILCPTHFWVAMLAW